MHTAISTGRFKVLLTAASILALTGMTIPSQSIDLGGAVSGAVGAAGGIAAGVSAGLGGGGVSAGVSGSGSLGTGGSGIQAGATLNAGLTLKQKKALILKHKSKGPKGLNANANAQILGGQGNIAKANAHVAFGGSRKLTTNADANLFVGHKHAGGKVNVFASTGPVVLKGDAGANVLGGEGNIAGADANLALGSGPVSLEADGGANVGTTGAGGNVNVALGSGPVSLEANAGANVLGGQGNIAGADANLALGSGPVSLEADGGANAGTTGGGGNANLALGSGPVSLEANGGANAGTTGSGGNANVALSRNGGSGNNNGGSNNGSGANGTNLGISQEIASLTAGERRSLTRKCPAVLSNPAAYTRDAVRVCRVVAQLAGL